MKILIVHKNTFCRAGLRHLIHQIDDSIVFIEAANVNQMFNLCDMHFDLSLVLLNLEFSAPQEISDLKTLSSAHPNLPVIVLCDEASEDAAIARLVDAGARGVINELADKVALSGELSAVLSGNIPPPSKPPSATAPIQPKVAENANDTGYHLTPRKLEVLALIKHGKSNKEIAKLLNLSEATVKTYCLSIYRELGVTNRTQAAVKAELLQHNELNNVARHD